MRVYYQAAISLMMALSANIQANAGDANPPIDNGSVTVDLTKAIILPSDDPTYNGMIVADGTHRIYLKCKDFVGENATEVVAPCLIQSNGLSVYRSEWAPYHTAETYLFFVPKATSFSGLITGSIGGTTINSFNQMEVLADNEMILSQGTPGPSFDVAFSGSAKTLKISADFLRTIAAPVGDSNAFYRMNMGSITWSTDSLYKLNARNLNGGNGIVGDPNTIISPNVVEKITDGSTVTTMLGSRANFTLKNATDGTDIPATFTLVGSPEFNPSISAADRGRGLYMDRLGILFSGGTPTTNQESVWLHMGQQSVKITPQDPTKPSVTINVVVVRPTELGDENYDCSFKDSAGNILDAQYSFANGVGPGCDALIIDQAHLSGLPPQYIKAEMWIESDSHEFNINSFRYEPGYDVLYISNRKLTSYDATKKIYTPLSNYKFYKYEFRSTSKSNLTTAQVHMRSKYDVFQSNGKIGTVPDNYETSFSNRSADYRPLTILDLVQVDAVYEKDRQNWFKVYKRKPDSAYNYVAQTVVASSYGLMQLIYPTAVMGGYKGDPISLLRPTTNVSAGAGTLIHYYNFINNEKAKFDITKFDSLNSYYMALKNASAGYKGGTAYKDLPTQQYAADVVTQVKEYWLSLGPIKLTP